MPWPFSKSSTPAIRKEPSVSTRGVSFSVGLANSKAARPGTQAQTTSDTLKQLFPGSIGLSGNRTHQDSTYETALLRSVSRHLCRDVALAHRFKNLLLDNILGRKPEKPAFPTDLPPELAEDIAQKWMHWCKTAKPFANSNHTYAQVERQMLGSVIEDGEVVLTHRVVGRRLELEVYTSDRFYEVSGSKTSKRENAYMGVITDFKGKPTHYLLYENTNPWLYTQATDLLKISVSNALHIYDPDSFGQYRGKPWILAAILRIAAVKEYDTYSSATMRILAKLAMFFVKKPGAVSTMSGREDEYDEEFADAEDDSAEVARRKQSDKQASLNTMASSEHISANAIVELPEGVEAMFPSPNIPAAHWGEHRIALVKDACAALGIDFATLMCDHSQTNFSGARQGEINNRDRFMAWQEWWYITQRTPIYREWLLNEYVRNINPKMMPEHFTLALNPSWTGKRWPWIDPLKDVKAIIEQMSVGLISPQDAAKALGKDWDKNLTDLATFREMCNTMGLPEVFDKMMANKMPAEGKKINADANGDDADSETEGENDAAEK